MDWFTWWFACRRLLALSVFDVFVEFCFVVTVSHSYNVSNCCVICFACHAFGLFRVCVAATWGAVGCLEFNVFLSLQAMSHFVLTIRGVILTLFVSNKICSCAFFAGAQEARSRVVTSNQEQFLIMSD